MPFQTEPCWFAIQVKSGSELKIESVLKNKGYETFVPTYVPAGPGRRACPERPLFSGYVFCRFDPLVRAPIVTTPGIIQIVGYGKRPAPLDDSEMEAVRMVARSNLSAKPHPYFQAGQRVRIVEGPLQGVEGIIARAGDRDYLVVSVRLLQRSIAIEMEPDWLEIAQPRIPPVASPCASGCSL